MADLSGFEITQRWPAQHPDRIQLYSLPTPNGVKASIMLEETGLPYEAHLVDFGKDDQKLAAFVSLNPNGKIPAMIDPDGPEAKPLALSRAGRSSSTSPTRQGRCWGKAPPIAGVPSNGSCSRWAALARGEP